MNFPGKLRVLGGVLGELLRRLPGRALALRTPSRETALFPAVSAAIPPALPPAKGDAKWWPSNGCMFDSL